MIIREYKKSDIDEILKLFYDTVHEINIRDYSKEQVDIWAPEIPEKEKWENFFNNNITYVAIINGEIVGFSDLTRKGYLNTMYIHKEYQNVGIATQLLNNVEKEANRLNIIKLTTETSITAKSFFRKKGFKVVKKQNKEHKGEVFINYIMEKYI